MILSFQLYSRNLLILFFFQIEFHLYVYDKNVLFMISKES